jgi:hypothetical protein
MKRSSLCLCLPLLLLPAACATNEPAMRECAPGECAQPKATRSPDEVAVRQRAAFDLRCEDPKLRLVMMDARTIGAEGCGRRATYTNTCTERDRDNPIATDSCTWVQTSAPTSDPAVK